MTTLAKCPTCGATGKSCRRPSEHKAAKWHLEREDVQAQLCGCEICQAWIIRRGEKLYRIEVQS